MNEWKKWQDYFEEIAINIVSFEEDMGETIKSVKKDVICLNRIKNDLLKLKIKYGEGTRYNNRFINEALTPALTKIESYLLESNNQLAESNYTKKKPHTHHAYISAEVFWILEKIKNNPMLTKEFDTYWFEGKVPMKVNAIAQNPSSKTQRIHSLKEIMLKNVKRHNSNLNKIDIVQRIDNNKHPTDIDMFSIDDYYKRTLELE